MSDRSKIEWTDATWTVTRGCSRVSRGCGGADGGGCYAERMAHRFAGPGMPFEGLTRLTESGPRWTGALRLVPEALDLPLRWRKPRRVFVNSMSDLFHEDVPADFILAAFAVMILAPQHTFQVLTKRAARMAHLLGAEGTAARLENTAKRIARQRSQPIPPGKCLRWPLPNVWLGVSVEDQAAADERIPHLLATPAAVRFLSCEPLLGPVDLTPYFRKLATSGPGWKLTGGLALEIADRVPDWVIVGGESGPGARPCDVAWVRSIVEQCRAAGTACFVKQLGSYPIEDVGPTAPGTIPGAPAIETQDMARARGVPLLDGTAPRARSFTRAGRWFNRLPIRDRKGGDPAEWPADLQVRQMPEVNRG